MNVLSFLFLFLVFSFALCGIELHHLKETVSSEVNIFNLCEGCRLMSEVSIKKLRGKKGEHDVYNLLTKNNVCRSEFLQHLTDRIQIFIQS
jgi:hypothetical protein